MRLPSLENPLPESAFDERNVPIISVRPGFAGYNSCMEASPSRVQLRLVAAGYAVVVTIAALLVYQRYLLYVRNPQDVAAAGGMYAGGDLLLEIILCFLLLWPTLALAFVIRKSELFCTIYARVLLGLSLTAPLSLALSVVPVLNQWYVGDAIVFRLFAIPMVVVVLIFSRLLTRFGRARRLISYALLVETLTLAVIVAGFLLPLKSRHLGESLTPSLPALRFSAGTAAFALRTALIAPVLLRSARTAS